MWMGGQVLQPTCVRDPALTRPREAISLACRWFVWDLTMLVTLRDREGPMQCIGVVQRGPAGCLQQKPDQQLRDLE
jgi:hypothetical protein